MSQLPILYSFRRCPYAMRARMAIYLSDTQCELREVSLSDKPIEMVKISPKGTVPVLLLEDETVIDESIEIMKWSLSQNDPSLILDDYSHKIEEMNDLIYLFDYSFKHYLDRYKYSNRYEKEDPIINRNHALTILKKLENHISSDHFIFGDRLSFVDMAILPFIRQFRIADETWFDDEMKLPKTQKWLSNFLQSDIYFAIMKKYDVWNEDSQAIYFP